MSIFPLWDLLITIEWKVSRHIKLMLCEPPPCKTCRDTYISHSAIIILQTITLRKEKKDIMWMGDHSFH